MNVKCGFRPLWTAGTERLQSDSKVAGYIISVWGFKEGMLLCSSCSHLHQGSARNRRIPWLWLQLCDGSALSKETTTHSLSLPLSFSRRLLFSYSIIRIGKAKGERERGGSSMFSWQQLNPSYRVQDNPNLRVSFMAKCTDSFLPAYWL